VVAGQIWELGSGRRVVPGGFGSHSERGFEAFLELAEFVEGEAQNEVRLGAGAVYGFLLLFGSFIDHGVEVQVFDKAEGFFDEAAAAETPCCAHDFGGEGLFNGVFGG
jgi:hypothetical protein